MKQAILDLKVSLAATGFMAASFFSGDFIMKLIVFILTVGYTLRRWYLLEKNKKE